MSESQQKSEDSDIKRGMKREVKKETQEQEGSSSAQNETTSQAGDKKSEGGEERKDECSICITAMQPDDRCNITDCIHEFHERCICTWLRTSQQTCPLCRVSVTGLRQLSGRPVDVPLLEAQPDDDERMMTVREFLQPTLAQLMAEPITSEEDLSDESFEGPSFRIPVGRRGMRTRRSGRLPRNLTEEERETRISNLAALISGGVGSSRRTARVADSPPFAVRERTRGRARRRPVEHLEVDMEQLEEEIAAEARRERNMRRPASNWSEAAEGGEEEEESSEESEEPSDEETEQDEESELSDTEMFDDDQPGPSHRIMQPVTRKRKSTKKKTPKTKSKTTKKKKKPTTGKTKAKSSRKRGLSREEGQEQRHRIRSAFPSLSLNGAAISPVGSDDDVASPVRRARLDALPAYQPLLPSFTFPSDVTPPSDLLGSILVDQTIALAPGRHLVQQDGRFVTAPSFDRHLDRMERRGVQLPDELQSAARNRSDTPQAQSSALVESSHREASTRAEFPSAVTSITRPSSSNGNSRSSPSVSFNSGTNPRRSTLISGPSFTTPLPPPPRSGAPAPIRQPARIFVPRSESAFRAVASSSMRHAARPAPPPSLLPDIPVARTSAHRTSPSRSPSPSAAASSVKQEVKEEGEDEEGAERLPSSTTNSEALSRERKQRVARFTEPVLKRAFRDGRISSGEYRDLIGHVFDHFRNREVEREAVLAKAKSTLTNHFQRYVAGLE